MRRTRIALLLCLAVGCVAVGVGWAASHQARNRTRFLLTDGVSPRKLTLAPQTAAIFAGATRVDTFRLADFHEQARTPTDYDVMADRRYGTVHDYTVLHVGRPQGHEFAQRLAQVLATANSPDVSFLPSCFDPGVGFRVWKGPEHVDVFVCFICSGVEIAGRGAQRKDGGDIRTALGAARPSLLALSREALPDDPALRSFRP